MASGAGRILPCLEATEPERPLPALTSDLHEQIFLRVASPTDLGRASAACVSFRRLIGDPAFLRRYRSIHPPLLLGFISSAGFQPAEAPHPSAAVARAADFSFDFVPRPTGSNHHWHPCDVRDGLVLIDFRRFTEADGEERLSLDLVVCDPLSRGYLLLPPMTDDLLASVELQNQDMFNSGASFIPSGGMEDETSFSMMCWMHSDTKLVVFFFSSGSDHWTVGTSTSWDDLGLHEEIDSLGSCQCVYGCFYWKINYANKLLKLDMGSMELSTYELPPDHGDGDSVIVEAGEGQIAIFSQLGAATSVEYYSLLQNSTDKSHEWHVKSIIPLPAQYTCFSHLRLSLSQLRWSVGKPFPSAMPLFWFPAIYVTEKNLRI
ncbi:hypothetical protein PVAP13_2NG539500 [Panicum virgatum]|uniref:F-box domain-containing protein n=1 Tax=Panicum virgatum TaxID=38727 RepID=A0A8T0VL65_PANVG|nr:hypothetical protein PVAP13_2NG539500 [Panicum virgatum]KAG2637550.1 hypothetical protein PVAP13_2NG539500 [Panicum virgatum]KAG2637551.1 hypothetical protein PVAP13_2NG539500 [Panicum virgatum]